MFCEIAMALRHREINYCNSFRQIKNHTLAGYMVLWVLKMALTLGKKLNFKAIFRTRKSNENTSYLTTKLLKTVTVNVLESN